MPTLGSVPAQLSYPRVCQLAGEPSAQAPLASCVVELARPWGSPTPPLGALYPAVWQGPPWDHTPKLSGCRPWLPIKQLVFESSFKEVRPAHVLPGGSQERDMPYGLQPGANCLGDPGSSLLTVVA